MKPNVIILGGGITGLAAGHMTGLPVYEAEPGPGGICSSYYVRPGCTQRLPKPPEDGEAYRFEIGGGHWIFGGNPAVLRFIRSLAPVETYVRKSSVYFRADHQYVPYPIQNHLRFIPPASRQAALAEIAGPKALFRTMKDWNHINFGSTLCEKFFHPFHQLYTAGLYDRIAPQDAYKSPVDLRQVIRGAFDEASPAGYNNTYIYPKEGLNALASRIAGGCDIHYGKKVIRIDTAAHAVEFEDGSCVSYDAVISTLPLNAAVSFAGVLVESEPDPYTSVLVLNIGAVRGPACPDDHWLYNPDATSGFHRVGFYSNVDVHFLPQSARAANDRVSIYVERAYPGGGKPPEAEIGKYAADTVRELLDWGYITEAEVVDPTWIDVAYTWTWPGSGWVSKAIFMLEEQNVYQVGRYARWSFQGIADSLRDGFVVGAAFRNGVLT